MGKNQLYEKEAVLPVRPARPEKNVLPAHTGETVLPVRAEKNILPVPMGKTIRLPGRCGQSLPGPSLLLRNKPRQQRTNPTCL